MIQVWCTTSFAGIHYWDKAKPPVEFLKYPHRHVFQVRLTITVIETDREVEFLQLKQELTRFCYEFAKRIFTYSCEQIAQKIINEFTLKGYSVHSVEVSEDGENGATVFV